MPGKVIIADDTSVTRKTFARGISVVFGVQADQACDGQELVDEVRGGEYDLIFTDYEMPNLNGIEATREIREFDKEIPIYMNSGSREQGLKARAIEAGVTEFSPKDDIITKGLDYFGDILKKHGLVGK